MWTAQLPQGHINSYLCKTDIFQGTWCSKNRDCTALVDCIDTELKEVTQEKTRPAFLAYLDGAPKLDQSKDEDDDPSKCGTVRTYFEYDEDYPDDDRICEEVKDLKVSCVEMKL